jgi:hypothetical protein
MIELVGSGFDLRKTTSGVLGAIIAAKQMRKAMNFWRSTSKHSSIQQS